MTAAEKLPRWRLDAAHDGFAPPARRRKLPPESPLKSETLILISSSSYFPGDYKSKPRPRFPFRTMRLQLRALQLRVLLHQFLQSEARKLYSKFGFFAFSLALIDGTLAILGMANLLPGTKSALAGRLFRSHFRHTELLATAREEFSDVLDRIVGFGRGSGLWTAGLRGPAFPGAALIFVFVRVVSGFC